MMDKLELREYRDLAQKIRQLKAEKEELLYFTAEKNNQPKGSAPGDPTGSIGVKIADISTMLGTLILDLENRRILIEEAISLLSTREYTLMHSYYILGHTWEQIAFEMHYSYRWVIELHGRILQKLKNSSL